MKVRFAGESASDYGGPLRDFLTLSMQLFSDNSSLLFGSKNVFAFKMNIEGLVQKSFYKLGQLTALSILLQSRGPECLHPVVVRALFCIEQPAEIEKIDDGKSITTLIPSLAATLTVCTK